MHAQTLIWISHHWDIAHGLRSVQIQALQQGLVINLTDMWLMPYWMIVSGFGLAVNQEEWWHLYTKRTKWRWTPQRCGTSWLESSSSRVDALSCWGCRSSLKETTFPKVTYLCIRYGNFFKSCNLLMRVSQTYTKILHGMLQKVSHKSIIYLSKLFHLLQECLDFF